LSIFLLTTTSTPSFSSLSLHDALPIYRSIRIPANGTCAHESDTSRANETSASPWRARCNWKFASVNHVGHQKWKKASELPIAPRSEEHTSELQSLRHLVCRLLLEKKKK